jgi:ectoine hydroxylase-related dioxygenase (phytanoyl-CoA dioxygenase family)
VLTTFPRDTPIMELKSALLRDGAIIIENLLTNVQIGEMMQEIKPHLRFNCPDTDFLEFNLATDKTDRVQGIVRKVPSVVDLLLLPQLLDLSKSVLSRATKVWKGKESSIVRSTVQLSDTVVLSVLPGETAQDLHRDDVTYHVSHPGPETQVLFMFALTDFTAENGATRIVPGSHLWDDERSPEAHETVAAQASRGSCVVWLGSTFHGSGANRSKAARTGLALVYCQAFLRQVENQYLAIPVEAARKLRPEVQKLIGYSISEPLLGFWELQDPIAFLQSEKSG